MKQVFISYVFEDKQHRDTLEAWAREGRLGQVGFNGEAKDVRTALWMCQYDQPGNSLFRFFHFFRGDLVMYVTIAVP